MIRRRFEHHYLILFFEQSFNEWTLETFEKCELVDRQKKQQVHCLDFINDISSVKMCNLVTEPRFALKVLLPFASLSTSLNTILCYFPIHT